MKLRGFFCIAVTAVAYGSGWENYRDQASKLLLQGRPEEARQVLEAGMREIRLQSNVSAELAAALNDVGVFAHDFAMFDEAERFLKESVAVWGRISESSPNMGHPLTNLAGLRLEQRRYSDAEKLYRRAERIVVLGFGPESPEAAEVYRGLADVRTELRQYREAEDFAKRALTILETAGGDGLGNALFVLAKIEWKQGRRTEAEARLRRAVALWRESLGPRHPTYASGLASLAVFLSNSAPAEAERLFREALEVTESSLGANNPYVGQLLLDYGRHLQLQGRKSEAKSLRLRRSAILSEHSRENLSQHTVDFSALKPAPKR